ncbi:MAG TPA: hypothetical protein PLU87_08590 [Sedimentisphaerales bacterium]|nr:hypothetical protein [Sedimentisphaerales bacterium]HRS10781.1 hypothetical protein [Sedimentisphaerales bacterium]HRV47487.1 hypothetical protein [Sedimentisphaerales bacterium]
MEGDLALGGLLRDAGGPEKAVQFAGRMRVDEHQRIARNDKGSGELLVQLRHNPTLGELDQFLDELLRERLKARLAVLRPAGFKPQTAVADVQVRPGEAAQLVRPQTAEHGQDVGVAQIVRHDLQQPPGLVDRQRPVS